MVTQRFDERRADDINYLDFAKTFGCPALNRIRSEQQESDNRWNGDPSLVRPWHGLHVRQEDIPTSKRHSHGVTYLYIWSHCRGCAIEAWQRGVAALPASILGKIRWRYFRCHREEQSWGQLNSLFPDIQFTRELENNNHIPFFAYFNNTRTLWITDNQCLQVAEIPERIFTSDSERPIRRKISFIPTF